MDPNNQNNEQNNQQPQNQNQPPQPLQQPQPPQSYTYASDQQPLRPQQPLQPQAMAAPASFNQAAAAEENPAKNYLVALLLSYFLGSVGADRFYLNKIGTGILKLVTLGGLGLWHLIDMLMLAFNKLHAKGDDRPLLGYAENRQWVKILAIVLLIFNVAIITGFIVLMVLTTATGVQQKARDAARKNDMNLAVSNLNDYATFSNGKYPTAAAYSNGGFKISGDLKELKQSDMQYAPMPSDCDNIKVDCTTFTLKARLSDGTTYTLNP